MGILASTHVKRIEDNFHNFHAARGKGEWSDLMLTNVSVEEMSRVSLNREVNDSRFDR
jgi:hypothetical protein